MDELEVAGWIKGARRGDSTARKRVTLFLYEALPPKLRSLFGKFRSLDVDDLLHDVIVAAGDRLSGKRPRRARRSKRPRGPAKRRRRICSGDDLVDFALEEARNRVRRWKRENRRRRSLDTAHQVACSDPRLLPEDDRSEDLVPFLRRRLGANELRLFALRYVKGLRGRKLARKIRVSPNQLACRLWRLKRKLPSLVEEARRKGRRADEDASVFSL